MTADEELQQAVDRTIDECKERHEFLYCWLLLGAASISYLFVFDDLSKYGGFILTVLFTFTIVIPLVRLGLDNLTIALARQTIKELKQRS